MPSNLGTPRQRRFDRSGQKTNEALEAISAGQKIVITAPFGGFCPDLGPNIADFRDCSELRGLISLGGRLVPAPGFIRLGTATLPLGDASPPAAAVDAQPVTGLLSYRDSLVSGGTNRRYAVTANTTLGRFYELVGSTWTHIPYTGAGAGLSGSSAGAGAAQTLCDFASYPAANSIYLSNGFDAVYVYVPGAANYTEFTAGAFTPFKARTICTAFDRVFFLNTTEAGSARPFRLRYTNRSATPDLTSLGSGQIDFLEVSSEGTAVRRIGNFLAVYFKRGTAFLRETGDVFDPFRREYISTSRGVIGPYAVTDLGTGRHFGIFNDGWFFLDDDGKFTEAGQRATELAVFSKWTRTFYQQLNTEQLGRTFVQYDPLFRIIWVLWTDTSSSHPNRLWAYDTTSDTVWPLETNFPEMPNVLQLYTSLSDTVTYAGAGGLFYDTTTQSYSQFEIREGLDLLSYGTRSGLVLTQDPRLITVDSMVPTWQYKTFKSALGRPDLIKTWSKLQATYVQSELAPPFNAVLHADSQAVSVPLEQVNEMPGDPSLDYANEIVSGVTIGTEVSGQHPVAITDLLIELRYDGGEALKPEGAV